MRTRQDCVVTLLEYVAPDRDAFKSLPGLSVTSGKKKIPSRVTVKAGQTLQQIAMAVYGDAGKWQKIATANNIRDPKQIKKGTVLRIP
jgi:nucleoid-associated protein YgaU